MKIDRVEDPFTFILACIGAWTVGKWMREAYELKRFMRVPADVSSLGGEFR